MELQGLIHGRGQLLPESNVKSANFSLVTKRHPFSDGHFQIGDLVKKDPVTVYDYAGYTVGSGETEMNVDSIHKVTLIFLQAILIRKAGEVSILLEHQGRARRERERFTLLLLLLFIIITVYRCILCRPSPWITPTTRTSSLLPSCRA